MPLPLSSLLFLLAATPPAADRLALRVDTGEAEAALAILDAENAGREVAPAEWERLFTTVGYQRLHTREAAVGAPFTDEAFKEFLALPATRGRAAELRRTLEAWQGVSPEAAAARAFAYLPTSAHIAATVFPMVKPRTNSFVYDVKTDAAIFLYLDPAVSASKFENTLAHELHHIGFGTACPPPAVEARWQGRPAHLQALHKWMGAYGEGFAMLAAAGGAGVHPHAVSDAAARARWDRDVAAFDVDLARQQKDFLAIVRGQVTDPSAMDATMFGYFGEQGPWYTVGWRMAATIEEVFGRERLIAAECDGDALLATYDAAVEQRPPAARTARWSDELLRALAPPATPARR